MGINVRPRTVANAQQASNSLYQTDTQWNPREVADRARIDQIRRDEPVVDTEAPPDQATRDRGRAGAMPSESDNFWPDIDESHRVDTSKFLRPEEGYSDYVFDVYGPQQQIQMPGGPQEAVTGGIVDSIWNKLQSEFLMNKTLAEEMIAVAEDGAAQPYDEKLARIGRDIADTRGRMDDLAKITDYYQVSLVDTWEKAAQLAREVDGDEVRAATMDRAAEIGRSYDASSQNMQAYLDRIGGVPMAQRLVIEDTLAELRHPYEGLAEADINGMVRITDAKGKVLETQAYAALADAQFVAETERFVTDGLLDRTLADQQWEEDNTRANRARAIDRAKRQANAQYDYTQRMPEQQEFQGMAMQAMFQKMGLNPMQQTEYSEMFYTMMAGDFFQRPVLDSDGRPVMDIVVEEGIEFEVPRMESWPITSAADLERAFGELDENGQFEFGEEDLQIYFNMFDVYEKSGNAWEAKNQTVKSQKRGGQAADNIANWQAQTPDYVQRASYVTEIKNNLKTMFPGMISTVGQMREIGPAGPGQAENSDHYSHGALDIFPTSVENGWAIFNQLETWDNVSFQRYRDDEHHMDHIHVSFLLPSQFESGNNLGILPDEGYIFEDTVPDNGISQETKDTFSTFFDPNRAYADRKMS